MQYVFDKVRKVIICSIGGGTVWFNDAETAARVSLFLADNPGGGEITDLVDLSKWSA